MNKLTVWCKRCFSRKTPADMMQEELLRLAESHYEHNKQLHFIKAQLDYVENRQEYLRKILAPLLNKTIQIQKPASYADKMMEEIKISRILEEME